MRSGSSPCRFNSRASASRTLSIIVEFAGDMEAVEHVQSLPGALGGEPLEEAREGLDLAILAERSYALQADPGAIPVHGHPYGTIHGVPRGVEDAGRVLLRQALGQLARNRPNAFVERCLPSAHRSFSTSGRPRDARRGPTESPGRAPARTGSGASQCGCSRVPGGGRRSKSISK